VTAILVAAIPILQFEFGRLSRPEGGSGALKVVSMNAASKGDPRALLQLVAREEPDIVVLQEWAPPKEPFTIPGYSLLCQEALCVLSRFPMERSAALDRRAIGGWNLMAALTEVMTPHGTLTVASVHLETPRKGIEAVQHREPDAADELHSNIVSRGRESRIVSNWLAEVPGPLLIAGDFNLPSDSVIYREHWTRWADAFAVAGWGYGWTKYTRWWGIRIDHILFDPAQWEVLEARVGEDVGSDHRPVVARLQRR
jgi:endonuclease/exonuclease/phosphatase (EEP) superfamily protein YafD